MRHRNPGVKAVVLLLALLAALLLVREFVERRKAAAFMLDSDEVRAVCESSGYSEEIFLERARTMGVAAVLLRPRGSRFDLDLARKLAAQGFLLAPFVGNGLELITFRDLRMPAVYLISASYENPLKNHLKALRDALGDGRSWLAFPDADPPSARSLESEGLGRMGARSRSTFLEGAEGTVAVPLLAGEAHLRDGLGAVLRAVLGRGQALVLLRLDPRRDIEENLGDARRILRAMSDDGYRLDLPPPSRSGRLAGRAERAVRGGVGLLLCVLGPLLALRCGVQVLHSERDARRWPLASPFRETLLASLAVAGAAAAAGLAACLVVGSGGARRDLVPGCGVMAASATLLLAAFGLYLPEAPVRGRPAGRPAAVALGWALLVAALGSPMGRWEGLGAKAWLAALSVRWPDLWWLAERWREWLLGYPCLFAGLCLLYRRLDDPAAFGGRRAGDPRPWLLLSMLAPMGLVGVLAGSRMPLWTALGQTVSGGGAGLLLGLLLYGALCAVYAVLRRRLPVV